TFKWKDTNGAEFENTITFKDINYPANLDTIARNAAYELFWVGDSLGANEKVILTYHCTYGSRTAVGSPGGNERNGRSDW
ncbi:MAG TPA: hypothetical protein PKI59_07610, partial [Candidatus Cloacimonadota bacterium]|nr:hypothetical protein [Candidatus Cloacimonadota bacterium]